MEYKIIVGHADELEEKVQSFLDESWELYGGPFITGKEVLQEETDEKKRKSGVLGTWRSEMAQAIIKYN
jgi:hypothetical protein